MPTHGDSLRAAAQMELKGPYPNITLCVFPTGISRPLGKDEKSWSLVLTYLIPKINPQQASSTMKPNREQTIDSYILKSYLTKCFRNYRRPYYFALVF